MSRMMADEGATELAAAFGRRVRRWSESVGGVQDRSTLRALQQAAEQVSLATSAGHVCVTLDEIVEASSGRAISTDVDEMRCHLVASGVVGIPEVPDERPLILDAEGRLYLHRYFDYEVRLAQRLQSAAGAETTAFDPPDLGLSDSAGNKPVNWQQVAIAMALMSRLTIISGGPGTGKTTTVATILERLLTQNPHCRIALAAPTGKAAARMLDAVRQRTANMPADVREKLPTEASTIHRLLGVNRGRDRFRHSARNPLPVDVLVVDEASMLDLSLATHLLEAVPPSARIILLGDKDQLSAVESGAVFAELSGRRVLSPDFAARLAAACHVSINDLALVVTHDDDGLRDCVVWLSEGYRFEAGSPIAKVASGIRDGRVSEVLDCFTAADPVALHWIPASGRELSADAVQAMTDGYQSYRDAVQSGAGVAAVTEAFNRFRILSAVRQGPRGVVGLNQRLSDLFLEALAILRGRRDADWYPGRPVMVQRNDYQLQLFNGDVGIALPDGSGQLMVYFPDAGSGFRAISPRQLPEHETAFAMTVHKAQGSEFDHVMLVLPDQSGKGVTRELLYTAVTRSRSRFTLAGEGAVLEDGIRTPTRRSSGLLSRLAEVAPAKE